MLVITPLALIGIRSCSLGENSQREAGSSTRKALGIDDRANQHFDTVVMGRALTNLRWTRGSPVLARTYDKSSSPPRSAIRNQLPKSSAVTPQNSFPN